jgi:RimJ/RimL family protein N-acetyltransferase
MHPYSTLTLETERLALRPLVLADAPALYEIFSHPEVARYGSRPPWTTLAQSTATIERDIQSAADGVCLRLGLFLRTDDALIGACTLFHINEQCRRAEIGYDLAPSAWGRGYATEAITALLAHGFGTMQLNRVEADIDPLNLASARALLRQGFAKEGLLRERWIVDGKKSDIGDVRPAGPRFRRAPRRVLNRRRSRWHATAAS